MDGKTGWNGPSLGQGFLRHAVNPSLDALVRPSGPHRVLKALPPSYAPFSLLVFRHVARRFFTPLAWRKTSGAGMGLRRGELEDEVLQAEIVVIHA